MSNNLGIKEISELEKTKCVLDKNEFKCAPGRKYEGGTCFTLNELKEISKQFNNKYPNNKIKISDDKKILLREMIEKIKSETNCKDQKCWLNLDIINKTNNFNIKYGALKPDGPRNNTNWLSTDDINKVLKQYEEKYPNFKYLGTVPYDFEEIDRYGIKNLKLNNLLNKGINKLGLVINLDKEGERGSHWVSLYIDLNKKHVYFFDSLGYKPRSKIKDFIVRLYNQMNDTNFKGKYSKKSKFRYNKNKHQLNNTECGVYSIRTIINLLEGQSFRKVSNEIIRDEEIQKCRKIYFR